MAIFFCGFIPFLRENSKRWVKGVTRELERANSFPCAKHGHRNIRTKIPGVQGECPPPLNKSRILFIE